MLETWSGRVGDTSLNGDLRFELQFKTEKGAKGALNVKNVTGKTLKVSTLQALNGNKTAFSVNADKQNLILVIPKAKIDELVKVIGDKRWPGK